MRVRCPSWRRAAAGRAQQQPAAALTRLLGVVVDGLQNREAGRVGQGRGGGGLGGSRSGRATGTASGSAPPRRQAARQPPLPPLTTNHQQREAARTSRGPARMAFSGSCMNPSSPSLPGTKAMVSSDMRRDAPARSCARLSWEREPAERWCANLIDCRHTRSSSDTAKGGQTEGWDKIKRRGGGGRRRRGRRAALAWCSGRPLVLRPPSPPPLHTPARTPQPGAPSLRLAPPRAGCTHQSRRQNSCSAGRARAAAPARRAAWGSG